MLKDRDRNLVPKLRHGRDQRHRRKKALPKVTRKKVTRKIVVDACGRVLAKGDLEAILEERFS